MKTALLNLSRQLALLQAFEAHFQPGARMFLVQPLDADSSNPPRVTFFGATDRQWILETFGADGWQTEYRSDGWQHIQRYASGVRVSFHQAYKISEIPSVPSEVNPALLIEKVLAPVAVQEVVA